MNHEQLGLWFDKDGHLITSRQAAYPSPLLYESRCFASPDSTFASARLIALSQPGALPRKTKRPASQRRPQSPGAVSPRPETITPKPGETPETFRKRVRKSLEILELEQDILTMDLDTLRRHFGYQRGTIKRGMFVRNVIWQVYKQTREGNPPAFVRNGGNIRSLWYHVKNLVRRHSRSFSGDLDDLFSAELTTMTSLGLLGYRDLNLVDTKATGRWVAPPYGTSNVILMAEKSAFSSKFIDLGKKYGVTVQTTGGVSSRVTVDTMLSEMAEAGHDLSKPFVVFALVDYDPPGWNIAEEFINQMRDLGLKKVRAFSAYGPRKPLQPWIDIVSLSDLDSPFLEKYRFELSRNVRRTRLADQWVAATGGLYGRGGKEYGLAADELIDLVDEHLARKLPEYLQRSPEDFQRLAAFDDLVRASKDYLTARVLA